MFCCTGRCFRAKSGYAIAQADPIPYNIRKTETKRGKDMLKIAVCDDEASAVAKKEVI